MREAAASGRDWPRVLGKVVFFAIALFLFILAIQLMKEGAKAIAPSLEDSPLFSNGISTLGAGWLGAYIVLSGSPIAAVALSLYVGGALTELQTFTMLSGSRLGASFVVLLVGFLYAMRNKGHNRGESIGMGVLALSLTAIVYVPGMLLGYAILKSGALDGIHLSASQDVLSLIDYIWGPALDLLTKLPGWTLLPLGLGLILISFRFLDKVLPQLDGERHGGKRLEWLKRPWPMFALGCVVATLTLSVSVALTVLGPAREPRLHQAGGIDPVHHGREHHDARRHARGGDGARQRGRGAHRPGRGDRRLARLARVPRVPVRADEAVDHGARRMGGLDEPPAVAVRRGAVHPARDLPDVGDLDRSDRALTGGAQAGQSACPLSASTMQPLTSTASNAEAGTVLS